jgi:FkbM family methyltransferase
MKPSEARKRILARLWVMGNLDSRLVRFYDLEPGDLVVDVGAFQGEFIREVQAANDVSFLAIEPIPEFIQELETEFASDPNVEVLPFALGNTNGRSTIYLAGNGSSAYAPNSHPVEVETRDVSEVLAERAVALMKINAEGAEFDILESLLITGHIRNVKALLVQFHDFAPSARSRRRALVRRLKATHRRRINVPWVWEYWTLR